MKKQSAGILLYKFTDNVLQVLLVHPGGPFWKNKDVNSWSIPKGEFSEKEDALATALREFNEETGYTLDSTNLIKLNPIKQNSGKTVYAWAVEKDIDTKQIKSNLFKMEWPPKSGRIQKFPEIDEGQWFYIPT
ncbi:MAG TPA: NUDIX domain-containing protein, partial [Flavobacteriaceae bacterium]|nr:NUDIX domain-containing protein [Flavobacteriaceae bacterium]